MSKLLQGGLTVRHKAHNLEIGGSIPPPARSFKDTSYRSLMLSAKSIRNLLTNNIRQGRSADPFLLTNGIFEKFHIKV